MTNLEIQKLITEKIYPKYITEQISENWKDIPIWLKHCDKEAAEKLNPIAIIPKTSFISSDFQEVMRTMIRILLTFMN